MWHASLVAPKRGRVYHKVGLARGGELEANWSRSNFSSARLGTDDRALPGLHPTNFIRRQRPHRHRAETMSGQLWKGSQRYGQPAVVPSRSGNRAAHGDNIIREPFTAVRGHLRAVDFASRYSGDSARRFMSSFSQGTGGPHAGQKHLHRLFIIADVLPGPLFGELPEFLLASGSQQKGRHRRALPVERRRMPTGRRRIPQLDFRLSLGQPARQRARMGGTAEKSDYRWPYKRRGHLRGGA